MADLVTAAKAIIAETIRRHAANQGVDGCADEILKALSENGIHLGPVWVLDLEATWEDDYVGWQSVHDSRVAAFARLTQRLSEHGLPWPDDDGWQSRANADDGSFFGDFDAAGAEVHIGVHRMPVES